MQRRILFYALVVATGFSVVFNSLLDGYWGVTAVTILPGILIWQVNRKDCSWHKWYLLIAIFPLLMGGLLGALAGIGDTVFQIDRSWVLMTLGATAPGIVTLAYGLLANRFFVVGKDEVGILFNGSRYRMGYNRGLHRKPASVSVTILPLVTAKFKTCVDWIDSDGTFERWLIKLEWRVDPSRIAALEPLTLARFEKEAKRCFEKIRGTDSITWTDYPAQMEEALKAEGALVEKSSLTLSPG